MTDDAKRPEKGSRSADSVCPECGTNLSARQRERERRRKWMANKRKADARNKVQER